MKHAADPSLRRAWTWLCAILGRFTLHPQAAEVAAAAEAERKAPGRHR